ncbi:coiled-coil domain-containing protein R3HCC1L isoform X2 [Carex littledalei]|uniref:Coiled-coil domain-containing protein R3HCC1L isoform X2 n=1 Tax=Carex littledalei TaxID=544730 RepID=A0A833RAD5_9POAL|nr:coiled-coil domain-containing protein R3HCC1L isoform X2 [Carex littledalei]
MLDEKVENWSEDAENLRRRTTDGAISYLERFISSLENGSCTYTGDLELAATMDGLADLYSLRGYAIKSDEWRSRVFSLRSRINQESSTTPIVSANSRVAQPTTTISVREKGTEGSINEEDWEALVDKIQEECEEANDVRLNEGNPGPITSGDDNQLIQYTELINSQNKVLRQLLIDCNRFIQTATPSTPEQILQQQSNVEPNGPDLGPYNDEPNFD